MESLGMKVLCVGLVLAAPSASLESQLWIKAMLNATTLSAGKVTNVGPLSKMFCAAHATRTSSADLYCHDQGQCSVSDLKIAGHRDDSLFGPGPVVKCWTKHACVWDGVGYVEGAKFTYACLQKKCVNGKVVTDELVNSALTSCAEPFQYYAGAGCFWHSTMTMTWCNARTTCIELGGDLATPDNFAAFALVTSFWTSNLWWIGAIGGEWLNGTKVDDDLWREPQVYDATDEQCVWFSNYGRDLNGRTCYYTYKFVCEIKV